MLPMLGDFSSGRRGPVWHNRIRWKLCVFWKYSLEHGHHPFWHLQLRAVIPLYSCSFYHSKSVKYGSLIGRLAKSICFSYSPVCYNPIRENIS